MTTKLKCPNCGHTFGPPEKNKNRRICFLCKEPINTGHKYIFIKSRVRHRNCSDPRSYTMEGGK